MDNNKTYNFAISLCEDDVKALIRKSLAVGMTAEELIYAFIGDLVDGSATRGSDERMYLDQWFSRCNFSLFSNNHLLQSLGDLESIDEFISLHEYIADGLQELKNYKAMEPDELLSEKDINDNIAGIKEDIEFWKQQIDDYYNDAKISYPNIGSLEEETKKVFDWKENYNHLIDSADKGGRVIKYLDDRYATIMSHKGFDICTLKVTVPGQGDKHGFVINDINFQDKVFDHPDRAIDAINAMCR